MDETRLSYDTLKAFGWRYGYHCDVHRHFDPSRQPPGREEAMWYLQPSVKQHGHAIRETILKYALAREVYDFILEEVKKKAESPDE